MTASSYTVLYSGKDRKAFLAARRVGIGASQAAAALGFSKFQTPYDVWEDKTGRRLDLRQTQPMEWGTALESVIARRFGVRHGHFPPRDDRYAPIGKVLPTPGVLQSIEYPWLLASPDRVLDLFDSPGRLEPLEIKTQNAFGRADWQITDEQPNGVPLFYEAQNQAQQLVMHGLDDAQRGWVVPLIGGNDMPDPFLIPFARDFAEDYLIAKLREWFEKHITNDEPPALTLMDDVNRIFPARRGKVFVATPRLVELVAERNDLQPRASADKKRDDAIKAEIKLAMLDATVLTDDDGTVLLTWDLPAKAADIEDVLDLGALKAVHPDVVAQFTTRQPKTQNRSMSFK